MTALLSLVDINEVGRRRPNYGRLSSLLRSDRNPARHTGLQQSKGPGLNERHSCAPGSAFYVCSGGFRGCCLFDPCTGNTEGCIDDSASLSLSNTKRQSDTQSSGDTDSSSSSAQSSQRASGTGSMTSSTRTATTGTFVATESSDFEGPACPDASGIVFRDSFDIEYLIKCRTGNEAPPVKTFDVMSGGYSQCLPACSRSSRCTGFTFRGENNGTCFLREQAMDNSLDFASAALPTTALYKTDTKAFASEPDSSSSAAASSSGSSASSGSSGKTPVGAIAGGVIGGVAAIALILAVLAVFFRRKRKKVDERRRLENASAPTDRSPPMEQANLQNIPIGHHRSGSTSNDVYTPAGGSYHIPQHARQRSIYNAEDRAWV